MQIRVITPAEADAAYDILLDNGRWLHAKGIEQWPLDWLASIKTQVFNSIAAGNFYCVETDNKIAAIVELRQTPEALWQFDTCPSLYIHKLAVRRSHSQKKLGEQMLHHLMNSSRYPSLEYIRLDCVASNQRLRNYYANLGFTFQRIGYEGDVALALYQWAFSHTAGA